MKTDHSAPGDQQQPASLPASQPASQLTSQPASQLTSQHTSQPVASRRSFLFKTVAILPAGAAVAACSQEKSAAATPAGTAPQTANEPAPPAALDLAHYTPVYFNADEWAFIKAATDRLIPSDSEGPGALDLNVPVYIDKQMDAGFGHASNWYTMGPFKPDTPALWGYQNPLKPRDLYRAAISGLNQHCKQTFSDKVFADLTHDQQEQLLHDMEGGKLQLDTVPVKDFFTFLLQNTKEGYLSDPMYGGNKGAGSWQMIGFPGARADFLDWVGQKKEYPFPPVSIEGVGAAAAAAQNNAAASSTSASIPRSGMPNMSGTKVGNA